MNVIQSLRFAISRLRPAVKAQPPGALYVNWPDKQIGVMDDQSVATDLIPIRYFGIEAYYSPGDLVVHEHEIYRAKTHVLPGIFNPLDWDSFVHTSSPHHAIGPYDPTRDYYQGDIILYDGELWKCRQDNGAGPFDILDWELYLANASQHHPVTTYDPTRSYIIGDLVIYNNDLYKAVQPSQPGPWTPSEWQLYLAGTASSAIHQFDPAKTYASGDYVVYNNEIWQAITNNGPGAWDVTQWKVYLDPSESHFAISVWSAGQSYAPNSIVLFIDNVLYKALRVTGPGPFVTADWEKYIKDAPVVEFPLAIYKFDAAKPYTTGDLVFLNGEIYRARTDISMGAFNSDQWDVFLHQSNNPATPHLYARTDLNLSDLANKPAARSNLGLTGWATHGALVSVSEITGLGNSATRNVGWNANEVAPGDQVPRRDGTFASGNWNVAAWPRRNDGVPIAFVWSGQGGQPPWLWGGSDGINMYVYNPSNFHVRYADSATNATNATNATRATSAAAADWATNDKLIISTGDPNNAQGGQNWLWLKV